MGACRLMFTFQLAYGTDTAALSAAIDRYLSRIRVKTVNRWGHAETLGTTNYTYPSKTAGGERKQGTRTDVRGHGFTEKPRSGIRNTGFVSDSPVRASWWYGGLSRWTFCLSSLSDTGRKAAQWHEVGQDVKGCLLVLYSSGIHLVDRWVTFWE